MDAMVHAKAGRALFYYFVEAPQDPLDKPLVLWSAKSIQGARRGRPNSRLSACSSRIRISKIS
jgi:hypothetical protein